MLIIVSVGGNMGRKKKQGDLYLMPIRGNESEYQRIMSTLDPRERTEVLLGTVTRLVTVPVIGTLESDKKPPAL